MTNIESPGLPPENDYASHTAPDTGRGTTTNPAAIVAADGDTRARKPIPPPPGRSEPRPAPAPVPTRSVPLGGNPGGVPPAVTNTDRSCGTGPTFPEEKLRVSALVDPVLDSLGHDARSVYVERYWLPILGPSCLLLLRRLAAELEANPSGFELNSTEWASQLGIGTKGGKHGPFWRAVERTCRFGAAQRNGDVLAARRKLPPLTARQIRRLPPVLQTSHQEWAAARLASQKRHTVTVWSERNSLTNQTWDDAA